MTCAKVCQKVNVLERALFIKLPTFTTFDKQFKAYNYLNDIPSIKIKSVYLLSEKLENYVLLKTAVYKCHLQLGKQMALFTS